MTGKCSRKQCRARRPPQLEESHAGILGRAAGCKPPPHVFCDPGRCARYDRSGRRIDQQSGLEFLVGGRRELSGLRHSKIRRARADSHHGARSCGHRIRVNTVVPGWIMTERQKSLRATPHSLEAHRQRQYLPDLIEPVYIARMVLFLASDDAAMCTANDYMVEAGSI